jgi:hypothetical protein
MLRNYRSSGDGVITMKAQQYRTQERSSEDWLKRLPMLIQRATILRKKQRRPHRQGVLGIEGLRTRSDGVA